MYQSFPQGFYSEKSSAMPIAQQGKIIKRHNEPVSGGGILKIFDNLSIDDIILIGIMILLLTEGSDDWLLIGLLAFILLQ